MSGKQIVTIGCVALLAMAQILNVEAEVIVLKDQNRSAVYERKQLCASEEDGSAMIWNTNLVWKYKSYAYSDRNSNMNFYNLPAYKGSDLDCALNSYDDCMSAWDTNNWSLTDSTVKPMGPVLDTRWEGFNELNNFEDVGKYRLMDKYPRSGSITISIRGIDNAHFLLCNTKEHTADFCYSIIIGGWSNTKSVIRKCPVGAPAGLPTPGTPCATALDSYYHNPLSPTEWRTFVLSWNETTRNITLYDDNKLLLTYRDDGSLPENPSDSYHFFIRSLSPVLYKLHTYSFLYTTDPEASLKSPEFFIKTPYICVQMLIGLCAECQMEIVLKNRRGTNDNIPLMTVKGSPASAVYGLPMWQNVKINKTLELDSTDSVRIVLTPKLERESDRPFWAIANVRTCPPIGTIRFGTMTAAVDYLYDYFWPNVTCQKMSYDKDEVVSALPIVKLNVEFEGLSCPEGTVGPHCAIKCKNHFERDANNCRFLAVCGKPGCTCPPGYKGERCDTSCSSYRYGHDCKESCGQCLQGGCNFVTGNCPRGCNNYNKFYIPPFCKTAIDKVPKPQIDSVDITSVRVSLKAEDEYKEVPSSYTFAIKKDRTEEAEIVPNSTVIYKNTTLLTKSIDDLAPGTVYSIQGILYIGDSIINGEWETFTTICSASTEFQIVPSETGFTVEKRNEAVEEYSCPASWYDISVREVDTGTDLRTGRMTNFPFNFSNLNPYTLYKIIIGKGNTIYYSQEVQTLEAAPTKVPQVRNNVLNASGVVLSWTRPRRVNGNLQKYEVTLKIQEYLGCQRLKRPSPPSEDIVRATIATDMTFTDLHPFAKYTATVAACNSKCGPEESTNFVTREADTPSAILHNLTHQDYVLSWTDPADCSMITGPIPKTRVIIFGVSDLVKNYYEVRQTVSQNFNLLTKITPLNGAEQYRAQIFAIRDYNKPHNETAGTELIFTTPPKAPPQVRKLENVEIDLTRNALTLRWLEPSPPLNGEIDYYTVAFCNDQCQVMPTKILPSWTCELWKEYICFVQYLPARVFLKIRVYAHNKNVKEAGLPESIDDIRYETKPDAPANFTFNPADGGVLDLKWSHPWRTGGHLDFFVIEVEQTKTALRRRTRSVDEPMIFQHEITKYMSEYSQRLYLHPSSSYNISVYGKTTQGLPGSRNMIAVQTPPSISFSGELSFMVNDRDSMINLRLPTVVNDTADSVMHIIVKGSTPCVQHTKLSKALAEQAGVKYFDEAWKAATISPSDFIGKEFEVGDNKIYGGATNCPLKPQYSYEVIVVLQADERSMSKNVIVTRTTSILIGEVPSSHVELWLVPIMILLIVAVAALYFYRRRSKKLFTHGPAYDEMPLSNNTNGGETKTITPSTPKMTQELPPATPSDMEFISRMSTPEIMPVETVKDGLCERMPPVKVNDFEDYVRQAIASGLLDQQYETFPRGQTKPWDYGKLPQNKSKNRYANLLAYDETRVILEKLPNDPYSDYINANYIKGYKKEKRYIATQGPKQNTVVDFWRMIWQEEVLIICMLANVIESGKTKCEQYWPDIGKKKKYGDLVVLNAKHNVFADYTFRTFHVTCGDITRKVEHLHYTAWPDHSVPLYTHSTVSYLKKLLATPCGNGPVVVHCSAGVGRTGTIILCDICLRRAAAERVVDVFTETEAIRSQRANMVDNKQQYLFAHLALVECLLSLPTALPCNDIMPVKIKELKKQLPMQRQRLQDTAWQDEALKPPTIQTSLSEKNKAKNRYPDLISEKVSRIYIKRYPVTDDDGDYVSGVYVDGVRMQNQYIAAQLPLPSTFNDFWRMVAELRVELIVMLQPPDPEDPTCCAIVPKSGEFKPTPYINVIAKDIMENEHYTSQKLTLMDNSEKPTREQPVTILISTDWKSGRNAEPPTVVSLVTLWQAAERVPRGEGPVVTLCHDGVTGCGLYLALSFLLERMAVERECDVCLAIRAVRRSRPDFVQSLEHMEYLYDAALTYLEYFETYANFN